MAREIMLNAFAMNTVGHLSPGLWRHPRDRSADYRSLAFWTNLAQLLERGGFDGLFIADVVGVYDVYGGSPDAALASAAQIPVGDPLLLVSAMAAVTRHLGFGVTANLSYEHPYIFARRMTTLDHLTSGRIGWNIVTGYLDSAARGIGLPQQRAHDERYDVADEYLTVVKSLWEDSWEDAAVVRDAASGVFVDPAKVHPVRHSGQFFQVDAIHLGEPSPQRTPVLYQAGTSSKGVAFAGRHAECVFVSGPSAAVIAPRVSALRAAAIAQGRSGGDIKVFSLATVIVAETDAKAQALYEEYSSHVDHVGALALMSGWTGIDFSTLDIDQKVEHVVNETGRSALDNITRADPSRAWTVRQVLDHIGIGGIGPVFIGTAATVADAMQDWIAATDVDGFNLAYAVVPETFEQVVDLLIPELRRRGVFKHAYADGTLRRKIFGRGDRPAKLAAGLAEPERRQAS